MATLPSISSLFTIGLSFWPFTAVSWQTFDHAPVKDTPSSIGLPTYAEKRIDTGAKIIGRLPVRIRRLTQCVILEWQVSHMDATASFVLYGGSKPRWETATILDLSIFAAEDNQTEKTYYSAVDRRASSCKPTYYWIVLYSGHRCEQHFGPFIVAQGE